MEHSKQGTQRNPANQTGQTDPNPDIRARIYSHRLASSFDFLFAQRPNTVKVEHLPSVTLDQADTLQHFGRELNTLVRNLDSFGALSEHDLGEETLDGETEDDDTDADECRVAQLSNSSARKRRKTRDGLQFQ